MATLEAQREYQRLWLAKRRADWFSGRACVRCGSTENLELDHIDPASKDRTLQQAGNNAIWSWSAARREAELAKCQVLCEECHKAKTAEDLQYKQRHGRVGTYDRYGCRCAPCKAAKKAKNAKRRKVRDVA